MNPITRYLRNRAIDRRIKKLKIAIYNDDEIWAAKKKQGYFTYKSWLNIHNNAIRRMEKLRSK